MELVKEKIFELFNNTNIRVIELDTEKVRFSSRDTKDVYINLKWQEIYFSYFHDEYTFDKIVKLFLTERLSALFIDYTRKQLYTSSNSHLLFIPQELTVVTDRFLIGFFKDGYAEFEIEENRDHLQTLYDKNEEFDCGFVGNFEIGKSRVNIGRPSDFFKLLFMYSSPYSHFEFNSGWENRITIKINNLPKNLKKPELNSYLQEALFYMDLFNPDYFILGSDKIFQTQNNYCTYKNTLTKSLPQSLFNDPICFYNEAKKTTKDTSFYYFYKVLEFLFPISQKNEVYDVIKEYDNVSEKIRNGNLTAEQLTIFCKDFSVEYITTLLNNKSQTIVNRQIKLADKFDKF